MRHSIILECVASKSYHKRYALTHSWRPLQPTK